MVTELQLKKKYLKLHSELNARYYKKHELSKREFDRLHGQLWNDFDAELLANGLRQPPVAPRDLQAEIDSLQDQLATLDSKVRQLETKVA